MEGGCHSDAMRYKPHRGNRQRWHRPDEPVYVPVQMAAVGLHVFVVWVLGEVEFYLRYTALPRMVRGNLQFPGLMCERSLRGWSQTQSSRNQADGSHNVGVNTPKMLNKL